MTFRKRGDALWVIEAFRGLGLPAQAEVGVSVYSHVAEAMVPGFQIVPEPDLRAVSRGLGLVRGARVDRIRVWEYGMVYSRRGALKLLRRLGWRKA